MHPHAALIARFYSAFQRRDPSGMAACYHPEVRFSDPVFPDLRGAEASRMWEMLCHRGKDLVIEFGEVEAGALEGTARWVARYTFSSTGRPVTNRVKASFQFRDGAIIRHVDGFPFWRWSRQALGPAGWALGWSGWLRRRVQAQAAAALARHRAAATGAAT